MSNSTSVAAQPDKRIQRTKDSLRHALVVLLGEKPWEDISVQDICDRAGIGRSTFYLHYAHKDELLAAGLDSLRSILRRIGQSRVPHEPLGFLDGLVAHANEQRQVFRSIIGRRSGHTVQRMFREMVEQLVAEDLATCLPAGRESEFKVRFVAGGIVEALALWVDNPHSLPAGELVHCLRMSSKRAATDLKEQ